MNKFRKLLLMKTTYVLLILIVSFQGFSQDSLIFSPRVSFDSINQKDSLNRKQGYWIIFGIDKPEKGFPDSLRIEEGSYTDNRKNGVWILYQKDGKTPRLIAEFKNGMIYEYEDVPHQIYTQFRSAKSQGSFFNSQISKVFKYIKIS